MAFAFGACTRHAFNLPPFLNIDPQDTRRAATSMSTEEVPAPSVAQPTGLTAADLIAHQALLERQAREAIPFSASTCTWSRGALRQPVFACKTCGGGGVCAGCSVSCHAGESMYFSKLFRAGALTCPLTHCAHRA